MNKFFFLFISIILIGSIGITNIYYSKTSSAKVILSLANELRNNAENNLKSITPTIRNILIQGNIRGARAILESWRNNDVFVGYKIFEDGIVVNSHTDNLDLANEKYLEIDIPIYYSINGPKWGEIKYYVSVDHLKAISKDMKDGFNQVFIYTALILLIIILIFFISILISTQRLTALFGDYLKGSEYKSTSRILIMIWGPMIRVIDEMAEKASDWRRKSLEAEKLHAKEKVYRQVSHDIRSPLAAISMAMKDLDQLPESTRLILRMSVQRIQDIANNLLTKTNKNSPSSKDKEKLGTILLYSSLDEIISEKRLQFRSKAGVQIEGNLNNGFGLFSNISNTGLKRVISNMINNATEALPKGKGAVTISLHEKDNHALIKVKDNGKGIPPEILSKLGKEGASFGKESSKESGSGIGLHHAIQTVKKWGGDLTLDSTVGTGTTVTIKLPLSSPPSWFLSRINLTPNQTVCILDDDHEIHHTWDEKFKNHVKGSGIKIIHFTTPEEVRAWFKENDYSNVTYLSDHELIGFTETGLDLIKELNLSSISTLVTSHYGEGPIQDECKKIGLKILPKMMAADIEISVQGGNFSKDHCEVIYIEDDKYLRMGWEKEAKKAGVNLIAIESPEKFIEIENQLCKQSSKIYIDQNYDDLSPIKGIDFAKELHEKGYENLYLATGYSSDSLNCPDWLEVTGKESPWE